MLWCYGGEEAGCEPETRCALHGGMYAREREREESGRLVERGGRWALKDWRLEDKGMPAYLPKETLLVILIVNLMDAISSTCAGTATIGLHELSTLLPERVMMDVDVGRKRVGCLSPL